MCKGNLHKPPCPFGDTCASPFCYPNFCTQPGDNKWRLVVYRASKKCQCMNVHVYACSCACLPYILHMLLRHCHKNGILIKRFAHCTRLESADRPSLASFDRTVVSEHDDHRGWHAAIWRKTYQWRIQDMEEKCSIFVWPRGHTLLGMAHTDRWMASRHWTVRLIYQDTDNMQPASYIGAYVMHGTCASIHVPGLYFLSVA